MLAGAILLFITYACGPPPVNNIYRKEGNYPSSLNVPVALLVAEWGGKPRVMGSAWLIDGGSGALFSAKHVTDALIDNIVEFGANECKVFLNGKVYFCIVIQVQPLQDAVVLKILGPINQAPEESSNSVLIRQKILSELPTPYKISATKLKVGDKVFIQGFHPHPYKIMKSNMTDGLKELIVPILQTFYELREADPLRQREIVFDSLEAMVVGINDRIKIDQQGSDSGENLKFQKNEYVRVVTTRNHKFSFAGLSGGAVIKINDQGVAEAVGIVTAEKPERLKYNKKGQLEGKPVVEIISDTILVTPIYLAKDLYDYARQVK